MDDGRPKLITGPVAATHDHKSDLDTCHAEKKYLVSVRMPLSESKRVMGKDDIRPTVTVIAYGRKKTSVDMAFSSRGPI